MAGSNTVRSPHYGALQDVVDSLYLGLGPKEKLRRLDIVVAAEAADLPDDLAEIVNLLPPGSYTRQRLCDQLKLGLSAGMRGGRCTAPSNSAWGEAAAAGGGLGASPSFAVLFWRSCSPRARVASDELSAFACMPVDIL